ncbi:hypothetical protein COLO4_13275 [Corchorus olitorius]|uniref:Uncharacterized protein n=1 Tax=Corchorus olitorius TaxID=93759 RepID=A0A1R3JXB6_9ROSI|nr:hypothetical protein COLO4_13275 [Corchorus olitorius]
MPHSIVPKLKVLKVAMIQLEITLLSFQQFQDLFFMRIYDLMGSYSGFRFARSSMTLSSSALC